MTSAGVTSFHDIYFDVRSKLQASTFIGTVVLGGKSYRGTSPDDQETILKSLGYELGGEMVDRVLNCWRDPPIVPIALDSLDVDALRRLQAKLRTKALILLETTPASAAHPSTWQWLQQRFEEARRVAQERGNDAAAMLGSIQTMLNFVDIVGSGDLGRPIGSQRWTEAADVRSLVETVPA